MRCHSMMWHRPPRVILWRRLREPDVSCVTCQMPTLQRLRHSITVTYFPASAVHNVGSPFHIADQHITKHVLRLRMQWCVNRHNIAYRHHPLDIWVVFRIQLLLHLSRQLMPFSVVKLNAERPQPPENSLSNAACTDSPHMHSL